MTTFEPPPYPDEYPAERRRTSGMAITALVLSILGIVPCCGVLTAGIGAIMGLVGVITIGSDPNTRGRGMSAAAIVIGVALIVAQIAVGAWVGRMFYEPISQGPAPALRAGFAGDSNGFRNAFHGPGATATDEEIEAFIEELRSRYGEFVRSELVGDPDVRMGDVVLPARYELTFDRAVLDAEADIILADEDTGEIFIMKLGFIRIIDPERGDLEFPPLTLP